MAKEITLLQERECLSEEELALRVGELAEIRVSDINFNIFESELQMYNVNCIYDGLDG